MCRCDSVTCIHTCILGAFHRSNGFLKFGAFFTVVTVFTFLARKEKFCAETVCFTENSVYSTFSIFSHLFATENTHPKRDNAENIRFYNDNTFF